MDTETVVIGHGRGSKFRSSHPMNQGLKRPNQHQNGPLELVQVYNGSMENPVGRIHLKTLVRFSRVAREKFPKPEDQKKVEGTTPAAAAQGTAATGGEAPAPAPAAAAPAPTTHGRGNAAIARGRGRGQTAGSAAPPKRDVAVRHLVVTIHDRVLPTNSAVEAVMQWMRDNVRSGGDQLSLLAAGETDLNIVLDLYQAALAFGLMPAQKHLANALIQYVQSWPPSLEDMIRFHECLPLKDQVVYAMMYAHDEAYMARQYTQQEIDAINAEFWHKPENEAFAARMDWIGRCRKRERRANQGVTVTAATTGPAGSGAGKAQAGPSSHRGQQGRKGQAQTKGAAPSKQKAPKNATPGNTAAPKGKGKAAVGVAQGVPKKN